MRISFCVAGLIAGLSAASIASAAATVYGITADGRLISFDRSAPESLLGDVAVTGLGAGESLVGIDARPISATGQLIVVSNNSNVYSLSTTGAATLIGGFAPGLNSSKVGIDFNPTVDRIRLVESDGSNRRLNPDTGALAGTDTALTYNDGSGLTPRAVGTAYNSFVFGLGAPVGSVRQFIIDSARDILGEVGSQAGGNLSFNGGVVTPVGSLGIDLSDDAGFDIFGPTQNAFISNFNIGGATQFYSLDLSTGSTALIGTVGGGVGMIDFAIVPAPASAAGLAAMGLLAVGRRRR